MASETITIARAELTADVSRALIDSLNAELSGVYSEPGATHFHLDAEEVAALALYRATGFHPIPLFGEYCLSPETSVCLGKDLMDHDQ